MASYGRIGQSKRPALINDDEDKEALMITTSHTEIDSLELNAALAAFRRSYPAFDATCKLDELRAREYARLDAHDHIYLDYTGGGPYAESQLRDHMARSARMSSATRIPKTLPRRP